MKQPTAARGSIIMLAVFAVNSLLGYALNIILAWLLPAGDYGVYGVAIAILGILTIFVIYGFPWTVVKFLSEETDSATVNIILKSAFLGNIVTAMLVAAVFYLIYLFILPKDYIPISMVNIILLFIFTFALRALYLRALHGRMEFGRFGVVSVIEGVARVVGSVLLVILGYGAAGALCGQLFGGIVALVIAAYLMRQMKFWRNREWSNLKVFTFAWPMLMGMLGISVLSQLDILVVKFLSGESITSQSVGYYQAIRILAMIPFFLAGGLMGGVFPFISRHADGNNWVYSLYPLRYIVLLALPLTATLMLLPEASIQLFFPAPYAAAADALRVLALGGAFLASIQVLAQIYQALGKPKLPAKVLAVAALLQITLLLILIPRLSLVGAATAMTISCLVGTIWLFSKLMTTYQFKFPVVIATKLAFVLMVIGGLLLLIPHGNRVQFALGVILVGVVYLILTAALRLVRIDDINILEQALPRHPAVGIVISGIRKAILSLGRYQ